MWMGLVSGARAGLANGVSVSSPFGLSGWSVWLAGPANPPGEPKKPDRPKKPNERERPDRPAEPRSPTGRLALREHDLYYGGLSVKSGMVGVG